MAAPAIDRRTLLAAAGGGLAAGSLHAAAARQVSADLIATCDRFAGLAFSAPEREQMLGTLDEQLDRLRLLRGVPLDNALAPAELFDPRLPDWRPRPDPRRARRRAPPSLPKATTDIAFAPAWAQAAWIAAGTLRSRELTELYLDRIARLGATLEAVATLLPEQARAEADARDRETARGHRRGPLHGLPYGVKDLFDTAGIETAWGAEPYRGRVPREDAVVVARLRAAGAILLAKTSCGALAYGDIWYGGRTRNPWNLAEGSSGSSAGSAAAVAAGLCSFAIGTETMGSIVSPAQRCGAVGLRPSFGRIARTGVMALCWSLDKVGILARDAGDAHSILAALNGADPGDPAARDVPLGAAAAIAPRDIRLGYREEWFRDSNPVARAALAAARAAGFTLVEVTMPGTDSALLAGIISVESAAAFEPLTLGGRDRQLAWQAPEAWPNTWRAARFEPAIGYVQAQRLRRRLMGEFAATMAPVDALLAPSGAANLTGIGNHTGYPALLVPAGYLPQATRHGFEAWRAPRPGETTTCVPYCITLTGHLFDEPRLCAIGEALARALPRSERPPLFAA